MCPRRSRRRRLRPMRPPARSRSRRPQEASIDQFSHGVSTVKIKQSESQSQTAKAGRWRHADAVRPAELLLVAGRQPGQHGDRQAGVGTDPEPEQQPDPAADGRLFVVGQHLRHPDGGAGRRQDHEHVLGLDGGRDAVLRRRHVHAGRASTAAGATGRSSTGPAAPARPYRRRARSTSSATGPVVVSVTDVLCPGDRFTLSDDETTLGTTSRSRRLLTRLRLPGLHR